MGRPPGRAEDVSGSPENRSRGDLARPAPEVGRRKLPLRLMVGLRDLPAPVAVDRLSEYSV
jgi:hypothetical protein